MSTGKPSRGDDACEPKGIRSRRPGINLFAAGSYLAMPALRAAAQDASRPRQRYRQLANGSHALRRHEEAAKLKKRYAARAVSSMGGSSKRSSASGRSTSSSMK